MKRWHGGALIVCGVATAVVIWQSREIRLASSNVAPSPVAAPEPVAAQAPPDDNENTRELARLRNEVTQLRLRKADVDAARRENARLLSASVGTVASKPEPSPPGFVTKEKLANVGYSTPEDTVQTFFWAMREGNLTVAMQSFAPDSAERRNFERLSPEQRAGMERDAERERMIQHLNNVGVHNREVISDDLVYLHVGSSLATNTVRMKVVRTTEGWKLHEL